VKESPPRTSTIIINPPIEMPDARTYCIVGQGRGGTTMLAKLVEMLGVPLTQTEKDKIVGEDSELRSVVIPLSSDIETIKTELEKRNANPVWAWKIPQCGANLPNWYKLIRNPFWIYVIRDHLASSMTELRLKVVKDVIEGLKVKHYHESLLLDFINKVNEEGSPILLISYERSRLHKGELLLNLIKFLGVNPTIEEIAKAVDFIEEEGPLQGNNIKEG
jgi:hypothetical protein